MLHQCFKGTTNLPYRGPLILLMSVGRGGTVKQFKGSGYHNFFGDRYQETDTYQQTDRPTIILIELLGTAKIKWHVTCDMLHVTCHMSHVTSGMLHVT